MCASPFRICETGLRSQARGAEEGGTASANSRPCCHVTTEDRLPHSLSEGAGIPRNTHQSLVIKTEFRPSYSRRSPPWNNHAPGRWPMRGSRALSVSPGHTCSEGRAAALCSPPPNTPQEDKKLSAPPPTQPTGLLCLILALEGPEGRTPTSGPFPLLSPFPASPNRTSNSHPAGACSAFMGGQEPGRPASEAQLCRQSNATLASVSLHGKKSPTPPAPPGPGRVRRVSVPGRLGSGDALRSRGSAVAGLSCAAARRLPAAREPGAPGREPGGKRGPRGLSDFPIYFCLQLLSPAKRGELGRPN